MGFFSPRPGPVPLDELGPLERRVLEALWAHARPASVRDLLPEMGDIAYTTLMTTLDRLFRKGALSREKVRRAFVYAARYSRDEMAALVAGRTLGALLEAPPAARPLLSFFVDEVGRRDRALLDELERLVREKQRERDRQA